MRNGTTSKENPTGARGVEATSERDPNGTDPRAGGAKLDAGKPCLWRGLIDYFPQALDAVATVATFGAAKYSWGGWRTVPEGFERYSDAMVRHLVAESAQGPLDNDSGLHHAAHVAWNALARLELLLSQEAEDRELADQLSTVYTQLSLQEQIDRVFHKKDSNVTI